MDKLARQRPGLLFLAVLAAGLLVRALVAVSFFGSIDIMLQIMHGELILSGQSAWTSKMPIGNYLPAAMHLATVHWGIPGSVTQKVPAIAADVLAAILLYRIARRRGSPRPWVWPAVYLLNPLTVMLSAYHGNIDGMMAAALLWALDLRSRERPILAGIAAGSAIMMKPTGVFALPALVLPLSRWKNWQLGIAAVLFCVAMVTPFILFDPDFGRFLSGYSGPYGNWGLSFGFRQFEYVSARVLPSSPGVTAGLQAFNAALEANGKFFVGSLMALWCLYLLFRWKRLEEFDEDARAIATTYLWFYAITTGFGVQYLSLAFPFILLLSTRLAIVYAVALSPHVFDTYVIAAADPEARALVARLTSEASGDLVLGLLRVLAAFVAWLACVWILWRLSRNRAAAGGVAV
jgi:hypothetical protein